MKSYILTADGRRVTPTARPLMREDVLFFWKGGEFVRYVAVGTDRLQWERA